MTTLLLAGHLAQADSSTSATATPTVTAAAPAPIETEHRFGIAFNEPVGWIAGNAVALSAYVAIDHHQVLRFNVASWNHAWSSLLKAADVILVGDGDFSAGTGRYTDFGAAWMYFPRRAFDGPSVELGALVRHRSTSDYTMNDDFSDDLTNVDTNLVGGRALIGWSWLMHDRFFISMQAGFGVGREFGTQVNTHPDEHMPSVTTDVHRTTASGEAFLRFGVVI